MRLLKRSLQPLAGICIYTWHISFFLLVVECRAQLSRFVFDRIAEEISQTSNLSYVTHVGSTNKRGEAIVTLTTQASIRPRMRTSMHDIHALLSTLEKGINFAYAHFNDGELTATTCSHGEVDYGWQKCSPKFQLAMTQALVNTSSSFFFGIPCFCEFPGEYWRALDLLGLTSTDLRRGDRGCPAAAPRITVRNQSDLAASARAKRMTVATVLINGNYRHAMREMTRILAAVQPRRRVHVIMSDVVKNSSKLPFRVQSTFFVPRTHAFDALYDRMRLPNFLSEMGYESSDIILLMCGPLGRILASEWNWIRPDLTILEIGSFFESTMGADLIIRGIHHELYDLRRHCMFKGDIGMGALPRANKIARPTAAAVSLTKNDTDVVFEVSYNLSARVLVIAHGQLHGGWMTGNSLIRNVLDPFRADLALLGLTEPLFSDDNCGGLHNSSSVSESFGVALTTLRRRAKYLWDINACGDWGRVLSKYSQLPDKSAWRSILCDDLLPDRVISRDWKGFLGDVKNCHPLSSSNGALYLAYRGLAYTRIRELQLLHLYDWFVFTRADCTYLCPPPLYSFFTRPDAMFVPNSEKNAKIETDRFAMFHASVAEAVLGITADVLTNATWWRDTMATKATGSIESLVYIYLTQRKNITFLKFDHVAFMVPHEDPKVKTQTAAEAALGKNHKSHGENNDTIARLRDEVDIVSRTCDPWNQLTSYNLKFPTYVEHGMQWGQDEESRRRRFKGVTSATTASSQGIASNHRYDATTTREQNTISPFRLTTTSKQPLYNHMLQHKSARAGSSDNKKPSASPSSSSASLASASSKGPKNYSRKRSPGH